VGKAWFLLAVILLTVAATLIGVLLVASLLPHGAVIVAPAPSSTPAATVPPGRARPCWSRFPDGASPKRLSTGFCGPK
jgi:hypothetical protein